MPRPLIASGFALSAIVALGLSVRPAVAVPDCPPGSTAPICNKGSKGGPGKKTPGTTVGTIDPGTKSGAPAPVSLPRTNLTFLNIDSFEKQLKDGDNVELVIDGTAPADTVLLRLRTARKMWFKGIEIHSDKGVVKLEGENGAITTAGTLHRGDLPNVWLVFVKAKRFGVHTPMYELPGTALTPLLGKNMILDWVAD